jgi:DNA-binding CsgD family transcriptional regulator
MTSVDWQLVRAVLGLTPRQVEIARLIYEDRTVAAIAHELRRSENTIRTHIRLLYAKLGVRSRVELVKRLIEQRDALAAVTLRAEGRVGSQPSSDGVDERADVSTSAPQKVNQTHPNG